MTDLRARLLLGPQHPCSYLPGRTARSAFIDPDLVLDATRYRRLLELGFRRSGALVYRPTCAACHECRAARIPVAEFQPDRSQRRCSSRNADLHVGIETTLDDEHYDLYRRYLVARHPSGGMDPADREAFHTFLTPPWGSPAILSVRDRNGRLLAGGVSDTLPGALSAVYTYFDPDLPRRGLGTFMVLQQLARARALGLDHLYLGFWIAGADTMDYKRRFRPLEVLTGNGWQRRH